MHRPSSAHGSPKSKRLEPKDLARYFVLGQKAPHRVRVGVEWEKVGVFRSSGKAIPYTGKAGVERIFFEMRKRFGWDPVFFQERVIALKKGPASITLEPGGQIELSGQPANRLSTNAAELHEHLRQMREISEEMGVVWLGIGAQPVSEARSIEWVPKERYQIMRKSLRGKGSLTYAMMKETASIQISLDYTSEADAARKLRLATALAPILSAMFANSPITGLRPNGFYSRRAHIWRHTDPSRTGLVEAALNEGFGFEDYVRYALQVPMLFIIREGKMLPLSLRFLDFMERGHLGYTATEEDWAVHLSTIFTEVRLKQYLEIRCFDCQRTPLALSIPALIKGLFYESGASEASWKLVRKIPLPERLRILQEVPRKGLYVRSGRGGDLWPVAQRLVSYAEAGLKRIAPEEAGYLEPLKDLILYQRIMPAELLLRCFSSAVTRSEKIDRVLGCASI